MADSFLYDRTISITRPNAISNAGDAGYLGPEAINETVVSGGSGPLTAIPATIELNSQRAPKPLAGVPSDAETRSNWKIFPDASLPITPEQIQRNDIVTDDVGLRYQVNSVVYSPLGITLMVELLPN